MNASETPAEIAELPASAASRGATTLQDLINQHPDFTVFRGTVGAPEAVEVTRNIDANYRAQLVLMLDYQSVIVGSLDIWHKSGNTENVYFRIGAASVDEALIWLEDRFNEWKSSAPAPRQRLRLVTAATPI